MAVHRREPGRLPRCLALVGLLALGACDRGPTAMPPIVLITLDTVRADHLSCYGYRRRTSPRLDAFAARATFYRRSFATSSWTVPTHASLFTGKHPFEHGADRDLSTDHRDVVWPLAKRQVTLAEVLRAEGYRTGGVVANTGYLNRSTRLHQGFSTWEVQRTPADKRNAAAFAWLDGARGSPFLLFVNYMDAHRPYHARRRPAFLDHAVSTDPALPSQLDRAVMGSDDPVPAELVQAVVDQYDSAIGALDEELGKLFDHLQRLGLFDPALIVVTSDHGEFFGEHRLVEHLKDVYQEVLFVPLVVKEPYQSRGRVVDEVVSSVDVPRLVVRHFPREVRRRLEAQFPYEPGNHPVFAELRYSRARDTAHPRWGFRFRRVRRVLIDWPFKFIASSDGQDELYDLAADPAEAHDLRRGRPDRAARMATSLARFRAMRMAALEDDAAATPSAEELEELRALGYVGMTDEH